MPNFTAGTSFTDGVTNDVTAAKLNALVADAVPTSNLALTSTNGTIANFTSSTANITLGTIPTLTAGTTTGTAGIFTSGTITTALIPTGTFGTTTSTAATITTGTIPTLVATTLITAGTGTAATPAIVPTGDTNTGIFFPAADTIAFSEGGTESMRIDSSGNVGIGNTVASTIISAAGGSNGLVVGTGSGTPNVILYGGASNYGSLYFADGTTGGDTFRGYVEYNHASNFLRFGTNTNEGMRIDSSGKVLIGTTSNDTGGKLEVKQASSETGIGIQSSGTDDSKLYFRTASGTYGGDIAFNGSYVKFSAGAAERLRIDSSGNLLVGTTSLIGNGKISVQANLGAGSNGINIDDSASSSGGVFARFSVGTGTLCGFISRNAATNAVLYNTSSDYRLKENVQPMVGALAKVSALKPCTWTWKEAGQAGEGFIAHEIQEIVPSAVSGNKDEIYQDGSPKYQGMDASYLVATLTAAIQEQQALIQALTTRITALEAA